METRQSNEFIDWSGDPDHICLTERAIVRVQRSNVRKVAIKKVVGRPRKYDLMTLRNSNIVQFFHHDGVIQVMDFADGGTLADNILNIIDQREDIAMQISRGLVYLHSMGYIHKKLVTSNILLTRTFDAKIAGFGSDDMDSNLNLDMIAPELVADPSKHSPSSDIFSLGRILESMGGVSKEYLRWMKMCLDEIPDRRPLRCPIEAQPSKPVASPEIRNVKGLSVLEALDELAQNGDATSSHRLATWYNAGVFKAPKDKVKAMEYHILAANQGSGPSQTVVGEYFLRKDEYTEAEFWLNKAAGNKIMEARLCLGDLYRKTHRYDEALKIYELVASSSTEAQYWLGEMHFRGLPIQDDTLAFKWFLEAANLGHAESIYSVGYMYQYGRGVTQSYEEAEKWYLAAVDKGNDPVQKSLKTMRWNRDVDLFMMSAAGVDPSSDGITLAFENLLKDHSDLLKDHGNLMEVFTEHGVAQADHGNMLGVIIEQGVVRADHREYYLEESSEEDPS